MGISVIVPVFNGERYLAAALASITTQTHPPQEVLVVDDGSTDASLQVARSFAGVRVLEREHAGKSAAMNAGIAAAGCELVAFLDCDDLWTERKLALQSAVLSQEPAVGAVYSLVDVFVSPDVSAELAARLRCPDRPVLGRTSSTALIRRTVLDAVGPFDERLAVGEFIEWYARARDGGVIDRIVEEPLVRRRLHAGNLGRTPEGRPQNLLPMLRAVLARRR